MNEQAPAPVQVAQRINVEIDEGGMLRPRNLDEAFRIATGYYRSGLLPKRYDSPEMVLTAMQFALELGLKPLISLRQIAVVNGTPSLFGDLPLSLCYSKGLVKSLKEYWIDNEGRPITANNGNLSAEAVGAICCAERKGDPEPIETFFTLSDAKTANLLNSPTWKAYPKRMLRYRARSQALKDKFPDVLNGVAIAEYDFHVIPDEDAGPIKAHAAQAARNDGLAAELRGRLHQ